MQSGGDGVFYTPADVARFIATETICDHLSRQQPSDLGLPTILDPACGTGALLAAAYDVLADRRRPASWRAAAELAASSLHGTDISRFAISGANLVLVERLIRTPRSSADPAPWSLWKQVQANLAAADSTSFLAASGPNRLPDLFQKCPQDSVGDIFPRVQNGFDIVLGNPPYAYTREGRRKQVAFVPFVEIMWRLTGDAGSAGLVLPLSIAYNSGRMFAELRRSMGDTPGRWRFAFFDRTPDSLFGDNVKTRNAIVFLTKNANATGMETTGLLRWSSRSRDELFDSIEFTRVGHALDSAIIPKLGTPSEVAAYERIRNSGGALLGHSLRPEPGGQTTDDLRVLYLGTTAYNWLPIYRARVLGDSDLQRTGLWALAAETPEQADAVFAVLSSRLIYWLWRVEGDGFHLPKRFVMRAPVSLGSICQSELRALAGHGRRLWAEVTKHPIKSVNSGKVSLSYSPHRGRGPEIVTAIDELVVTALGLPVNFAQELNGYVRDTVVARRDQDQNGEST